MATVSSATRRRGRNGFGGDDQQLLDPVVGAVTIPYDQVGGIEGDQITQHIGGPAVSQAMPYDDASADVGGVQPPRSLAHRGLLVDTSEPTSVTFEQRRSASLPAVMAEG